MSLRNFLFSKVFVKNLALAVALAVGLLMILLIWLNIYTRHGQARPVPDFYGLNLEETAKLARKNKLKFQVIDSVYTSVVPSGCVAEQNPEPGFKVKKRRRILLTINAFNPEMIKVPNVVGLPKRQAIAMIQSAGLEAGQLRYIPDLSFDFVIKQLHNGKDIAEGESIPKESVIDLVLGKGLSNQRTPVPDLMGLKLDAARNMILGASLNLGAFIYDNSIATADDTTNAFVFKQNPEYKETSTLQLGSGVYLWLTVDSAKLPVDSTLIIIPDSTLKITEKKKEVSNQVR
jgi:eukaryotic-like serine/threonine-protein kinase